MPLISEQGIARIQSHVASLQNKISKAKVTAEVKAGEVKDGLEIVGAAALMGFARGKMEASDKTFTVPGTSIDIELLVGLGLAGAGLMDAFGKYDDDAMMVGYGLLAHYMGQVGRSYGKSGEFSLVAGGDSSMPVFGAMPSELAGII